MKRTLLATTILAAAIPVAHAVPTPATPSAYDSQQDARIAQMNTDLGHQAANNQGAIVQLRTDNTNLSHQMANVTGANSSKIDGVRQLADQNALTLNKHNLRIDTAQSTADTAKTTADGARWLADKNALKLNDHTQAIQDANTRIDGVQTLATRNAQRLNDHQKLIIDNTSAINTNADGIAQNAKDIAGKVAQTDYDADKKAQAATDKIQDTKLTGFKQKTDATNAAVTKNTGGIATNTGDIATLKSDVSAISPVVAQNTADIAQNKADQDQTNQDFDSRITRTDATANKANIAATQNTGKITALDTQVKTNGRDITTNKNAIAANKGLIDTNTQGVADNKAAIATNTSDIATNKADIATKVSQSDFDKDQQRQDTALGKVAQTATDSAIKLNGEIKANTALIAKNTTALGTKADKADLALKANTVDVTAADNALSGRIDTNKQGIADNAAALKTEASTREVADKQMAKQIATKVDTSTFTTDQTRQDDAARAEKTRVDGELAKKAATTDLDPLKTDIAANTKALGDKLDTSVYTTDKATQAQRDTDQDTALALKVDDTAFKADQTRQDDAAKAETQRVDGELAKKAALTDLDPLKNDIGQNKTDISGIQTTLGQKATSAALTTQGTALAQGEVMLAKSIQANQKDIQNKADTTALTDETNRATKEEQRLDQVKADKAEFNVLQSEVKQKVDTKTFTQRSAVVDQRFKDTQQRIDDNKAEQAKVNKAVADTLDNHEDRIYDLEHRNNQSFANLKNQIDKNAKKANAGTSTALAAAGIPQVTGDQNFNLGAALGGYEGENAVAVGFSARVNQAVTVKASVGTDSQHGVGYNAGVAIGW